MPKLVGDMQTRELTYTGRTFGGQEAKSLGLVLESFATHAEMEEAVANTAAAIAKKPPLTLRGAKTTLL